MMPIEIFYFEGDSKHDPGHYWFTDMRNKFDNGPFFSYSDAARDAGAYSTPTQEPDDDGGVLMNRATLPKALVRIESTARGYMLGASLLLFCLMSWYGVYKLAFALMGF